MLLRKSERSSIGDVTWRSITTKSGSRTIAATKPPITSGSSQPVSAPFDSASTSPVSPRTNVAFPSRSSPRSFPRPDISCRTSSAQPEPSSPSGTLNQKTQLHEISTSAPPSTGPITSPTAAIIVFVPIASPSSSFGNASVTSAAAFAKRNAAPTPCSTRQRISCVPLPEKPAPSDASENATKPSTYAFFRPKRSDSRPAASTSTVETIM